MTGLGSISVPTRPHAWTAPETRSGTGGVSDPRSTESESNRVSTQGAGGDVELSRYSGGSEPDEPAVYSDPRLLQRQKLEQAAERKQQSQQVQEIQALAQRDREVRAHEQAHMAAGGQYAGAASYQFERGPDGVSYAVSGEVPISTGKEATPQATLLKAQILRRAALAPAEPSAQDRKVAVMASRLEAEARLELLQEQQILAEQAVEQRRDAEPQQNQDIRALEPQANAQGRSLGENGGQTGPLKVESSQSYPSIFSAIQEPQRGGNFHQIA